MEEGSGTQVFYFNLALVKVTTPQRKSKSTTQVVKVRASISIKIYLKYKKYCAAEGPLSE